MRKTITVLISMLFLGGCMGGHHYSYKGPDGSTYNMTDVGHSNLMRNGMQYSVLEKCLPNGGPCSKVSESTSVNPSWFDKLAGSAAMVGSAALIGDGIRDSGDSVSVNSSASAGAKARASGGCKGNCGGK